MRNIEERHLSLMAKFAFVAILYCVTIVVLRKEHDRELNNQPEIPQWLEYEMLDVLERGVTK